MCFFPDDDRHSNIIIKTGGRSRNFEFDTEFEKFYSEEKIEIGDRMDDQVRVSVPHGQTGCRFKI
jgi:hypothetical protein